jgi:hypothetical protein
MAARITELVNATLQAEAGPRTQLTEAQVHTRRSAMPHHLHLPFAEPIGMASLVTVQANFHGSRGSETLTRCLLCRCWT